MRPTRSALALAAALSLTTLGACATEGQDSEVVVSTDAAVPAGEPDAAADTAVETGSMDFSQTDVDYATALSEHLQASLTLADLGLEQGTEAIQGLAGDIRSHRAEEVELLTRTLEGYGAEPPVETGAEPDEDLSGLEGAEFDSAWLDRMLEQNEEAMTLVDEELGRGTDPVLVNQATLLSEKLTEERSQIEQLREG